MCPRFAHALDTVEGLEISEETIKVKVTMANVLY